MIINARPPNFDQILAAFPKADGPGVLFAHGEFIYNPSGVVVPPALVAHESVHIQRQRRAGSIEWWSQYLTDNEFRYNEELLAHAAEFKALKVGYGPGYRNHGAALLVRTAMRLIAPLYNYQPPRTLQGAMRDLRQEIER